MKNNEIKFKPEYNKSLDIISYAKKIQRLENKIKDNQKEISEIDKDYSEEKLEKIDADFYTNLKELGDLIEIQNYIEETAIKTKISQLDNLYKEVQNTYINKKIKLIDEKMSFVNKDMNEAIERVRDNTNSITGNILFSVIAIVLGISLVSTMTSAISSLEPKYYLSYYVTIGWLAILVLGFSYLLLRTYDKKSTAIIIVIGFATWVLSLVFYFSFFK